jgi:putative membrane protein
VEGSEVSTVMYWDGSGWAWMAIMSPVWIVLIGLIIWAAIHLTQHPTDRDHDRDRRENPEQILDRRYASGEIDADAHTHARQRLAEHRPRAR